MKKIKSRKERIKKYSFFKKVVIFSLIIVGGYCSSYVDAGISDTVMEKNRMDGIYAVMTLNEVNRIFYLDMYEMNGKVAYCIDLGVKITTSIYHSTNDFSGTWLTDEQIDYIRSISYFGYRYEGHLDYQYYMAAQELIWEYLNDTDVFWSNEMSINGTRINIDVYKEEILRLRDWYNKKLDFEWVDGGQYTVGEEIVLMDRNLVLSDFEVVSSKYSDVSIDGNNLVIRVGNAIGEEKIDLKRRGYYDYDGLLYYYDISQKLISSGNYKKVDKSLSFQINGVTLNGKVVDKATKRNRPSGQATLEGAVYELYNANYELVGTYQTDKNGLFEVDNLLLGTYHIKQLTASEGYSLNPKVVTFLVDEDNFEIILEQEVIKNTIEIKKVYGSNGYYEPEGGILFEIYDIWGNVRCNLVTRESGGVSVELPYGVYRVHQSNTMVGYAKVDDFWFEVNEVREDKVYFNLVNELILAKVKVVTCEAMSGEQLKLDGFSYRIRKKSENTYLEFDGKDIFATDSNGEVLLPIFLSYGDYVLEQVDTPMGILLTMEELEFSLDDDSNFSLVDGNLVMEVSVYNEFIKGKIEILASEEKFYSDINHYYYEKEVRSDGLFSLIANEDIVINGGVMYQKGQEVFLGVSDENGKLIIDNLYLGSYCVIDDVISEDKCFTLESNDNTIKIVEKKLEFIKTLSKGDVIIQNVGDESESISGSVFEVIDKDGVVIYTGVTNEEGIIKVESLLKGDYCVRQKSVLEKYQMVNEEQCFLLDGEKRVTFMNSLINRKIIRVPNTLSESIGVYEGILILFMVGTGIFVYKKIFASNLYR